MLRPYSSILQSERSCLVNTVLLAVSWIAGLILGSVISQRVISEYSNSFYIQCFDLSLISLFFVSVIPAFLSVIAIQFHKCFLILVIFFKAVFYSLSSVFVVSSFEDAGWLARIILLFSDTMLVILLQWFWLQLLNCSQKQKIAKALFVYAIVAAGIISFDFLFVYPLSIVVFNY